MPGTSGGAVLTARALSLRVAGVSLRADAALVATDSVQTADVARLATHLADAARAVHTVSVRATLGLHTAARRVSGEAGRADAHRPPLLDAAHGRRRTRLLRARVSTGALDAGEVGRTVGAASAAGQRRAAGGRVAAVPRPALTCGLVVHAPANGRPVARIS